VKVPTHKIAELAFWGMMAGPVITIGVALAIGDYAWTLLRRR